MYDAVVVVVDHQVVEGDEFRPPISLYVGVGEVLVMWLKRFEW